jgi:preprotein translocase subunit YajC
MLDSILLQAQSEGGNYSFMILMVGMLIVFYFFILRPQQKKQKSQKKFSEDLKRGESVVTIGGIHGKVFEISQDTIILEVEKGGKIKLDKSAISFESSTKKLKK